MISLAQLSTAVLIAFSDSRSWTLRRHGIKFHVEMFEMPCYRRAEKTASYQMAGLPDQRIHQKTTQSPTHHCGRSQASQARTVWSHMPHAGQQNIKESVVWGGGRSHRNYQGQPRKRWVDDILKWCDMTLQQASHHAQDRATWRNLIAGPYGSWTTGQEEEEELFLYDLWRCPPTNHITTAPYTYA